MRVVFDTNVLVAAFLTEGLCSGLLVRARKKSFDLVLCDHIVAEFEGILKRKFKLTEREISEIAAIVSEAASEILTSLVPLPPVCGDRSDDMIIACAIDGGADYIVTGDEDLLVLKKYKKVKIISTRSFEALFSD